MKKWSRHPLFESRERLRHSRLHEAVIVWDRHKLTLAWPEQTRLVPAPTTVRARVIPTGPLLVVGRDALRGEDLQTAEKTFASAVLLGLEVDVLHDRDGSHGGAAEVLKELRQ